MNLNGLGKMNLIINESIDYIIYGITRFGKFEKYLCIDKSGECFMAMNINYAHKVITFSDWFEAMSGLSKYSYLFGDLYESVGVRILRQRTTIEDIK